MERLTHERSNGIKSGYWSPNKKQELVDRLAKYEDTGLTTEEIMDGKILTGWIPVEERLPDLHKEMDSDGDYYMISDPVLITYDGGKIGISEYEIDDGCQCIWNDLYEEIDVIAWMPLPEPYKEPGNE